ncbi:MAG: type II toxin-antitoxin system HicB family antitoxin [Methanothrix sp.]|jgi:predicted RNase H-like HicB family nuclease|nr:type II toxin-antitoxin system HicB family antitoxin [Methanothrix sp.]
MFPATETNLSKEIVSAKSRVYRFLVVIEKDKDGYFAFTPELQGCYTQGDTYEEVLENIRDAIRLHVEDRLDSGEEVPQPESVSLTSLEVAV